MTRNGTSQVLRRQERIINLRLERQEERRQDEAANAQRFAENMLLDAPRGELVAPPTKRGDAAKPQRRVTGIEWLLNKGRIAEWQATPLARYGVDYRTATREVSLRSGLDFTVRGGEPPDRTQAMRDAEIRLEKAQREALHGLSEIILACNTIAGQQKTPREAAEGLWRTAEGMTITVCIAAKLLAKHYGLPIPEDETQGVDVRTKRCD